MNALSPLRHVGRLVCTSNGATKNTFGRLLYFMRAIAYAQDTLYVFIPRETESLCYLERKKDSHLRPTKWLCFGFCLSPSTMLMLTNLVVFFGLINFTMLMKDKFVRACRQSQLEQTRFQRAKKKKAQCLRDRI